MQSRTFHLRGDRIRTYDSLLPKQVRYRTAPRPVIRPSEDTGGDRNCQGNRACGLRIRALRLGPDMPVSAHERSQQGV